MKKVAILPGFTEGNWHTVLLRDALTQEGFKIAPLNQADIIITHSAGAYLPAARKKVELLVIVGLPIFSRKKTMLKINQKIYHDFRAHRKQQQLRRWARKNRHNIGYFFSKPRLWVKMLRHLNPNNLSKLHAKKVVLINGKRDIFNKPDQTRELAKKNNWGYYSVDGSHDDIWENPEKYVDIIKACL